ncbi:MAG: flagellar protein FlaG [Bryobacteraceae bacterium]
MEFLSRRSMMEISAVGLHTGLAGYKGLEQQRSTVERSETRTLIQATQKLNQTQMFGYHSELVFAMDRQTGRPLVRLIDKETREVLRQFPPEHVLRMAEDLKLRA